MNFIDNAALAQNIKDGIAQAQAAGLALEDHLPAIIDIAVMQEISKVEAVITSVLDLAAQRFSGILNDAIDRIDGASISRGSSADARAILGEIVLSIPPRK